MKNKALKKQHVIVEKIAVKETFRSHSRTDTILVDSIDLSGISTVHSAIPQIQNVEVVQSIRAESIEYTRKY